MRKWFQLPVSANIEHLSLPTRKLGVNFSFAKTVYTKCKLSVRRILRLSKNTEIKKLYDITSFKHVRSDSQINSIITNNEGDNRKQICAKSDKLFNITQEKSTWSNFMNLKEQNIIVKHMISVCSPKVITMWQKLMERLPNNIFCFVRKALIFCLPNKTNLLRWKLIEEDKCSLCKERETMLHVFSNCVKYLERYTWRHDSVLKLIVGKIARHDSQNVIEIFVDLAITGYKCTSELFESSRPDIVVINGGKLTVIELTVCFDTNTEKSRQYKKTRYQNLKSELLVQCEVFEILYLEITTLGFISKESFQPFIKFLREIGTNEERTIVKSMETVIRATYFIFCRRNKQWDNPELLNFY